MVFALLKTFLVIIVGTFSGYLCQKIIDKKNWLSPESKKNFSVFLQKLGMLWLVSITYIGSLWIYKIENITKIISLPFVEHSPLLQADFLQLSLLSIYAIIK